MAATFEHPVNVRWRDTDALGHVNHAVFLTYLEEGRDAFFTQVLGSDPIYVVVRLEVDLHAEVRYEDRRVTVRIEVERIGATSLITRETLLLTPPTPNLAGPERAGPERAGRPEHADDTGDTKVAAQARVVTVRWDADRRKPTPFTQAERSRLAAMSSGVGQQGGGRSGAGQQGREDQQHGGDLRDVGA